METPQSVVDLTSDSPPLRAQGGQGYTQQRRRRRANDDDDVSIVGVSVAPRAVSPNQRIHEGIPPGPYARQRASSTRQQPPGTRQELVERLQYLAARYANSCGHIPPKGFDRRWTHPVDAAPGFAHSVTAPAIDLEAVMAGDEDAVVPLPDTTPICARCRRALFIDGADGRRIWALPCGHVIDGYCVAQLSVKVPGKSEVPPRTFVCPVDGCTQRCHPEPGHRHSCVQVYI